MGGDVVYIMCCYVVLELVLYVFVNFSESSYYSGDVAADNFFVLFNEEFFCDIYVCFRCVYILIDVFGGLMIFSDNYRYM